MGERIAIATKPEHIVYADDQRLICFLWNHKDAAETCIDENTQEVVFFIDSANTEGVQLALDLLAENLRKIDCMPLESGILNKSSPKASIALKKAMV